MGVVSTSFAVACLGTLSLCLIAAHVRTKALHLFGTASYVFVMFWISRAISQVMDPPWSMAIYPLQDVTLIALLWWTWGRPLEWWRVTVGLLLLAQLGFHSAFWGLYVTGQSDVEALRTYILFNNVGLAGILATLSFRGGAHVVAWLSDLRGVSPLPGWGGGAVPPLRHR